MAPGAIGVPVPSTQLVFCDLSTPNPATFNVYDEVRTKLLESGVPKAEIAFIHDAAPMASRSGKIRTSGSALIKRHKMVSSVFKLQAQVQPCAPSSPSATPVPFQAAPLAWPFVPRRSAPTRSVHSLSLQPCQGA